MEFSRGSKLNDRLLSLAFIPALVLLACLNLPPGQGRSKTFQDPKLTAQTHTKNPGSTGLSGGDTVE